MKLAAHTFTKPELLAPSNTNARRSFLIKNHKKLIKRMQALSDGQHKQSNWIEPEDPNSWCGTSACALGWAVIGGDIKGLQYVQVEKEVAYTDHGGTTASAMLPIVNGAFLHTVTPEIFEDNPYELHQSYQSTKLKDVAPALQPAARTALAELYSYDEADIHYKASIDIWSLLGVAFFGADTFEEVFANGGLKTQQVIDALKHRLQRLEHRPGSFV